MKQETIKGRASWLTALMAGAMLVSCSNDMQMPSGGADGSAEGKVTFNISLPSTEKVIYGGGTRALHDEAEYNVTTLDVYEYDVNTGFVAKHTFSAADGSIRPAGEGNITGEYTVTITEDLAEVGSLRRFYFVANNANGVTPAKGTDYETGLRDEAADIALASGTGSSVLCPEGGIAMSGLAVNTETNGSDITIKSGAMNNVHVDLTRIVGRVDLYSNADNLVITGARMEKAAEKGYLMADHSLTSTDMPGEIEMLDINANAGVAASGEACLPAANAGYSAEISTIQQYNDGNGTGVRKAFYMYERDNSEGDCTQIVVSYALADGTTGEAVVPFTKTDDMTGAVSYVNIERNHLYKVVLGNGEDITPGSEVEVKIIDTPWNVVDLPVVVEGPEQENVAVSASFKIGGTSYEASGKDLNSAICNILGVQIDEATGEVNDTDGKLLTITELSISKEQDGAKAELTDDEWTFFRRDILGMTEKDEDVVSIREKYYFYECKGSLQSLDLRNISLPVLNKKQFPNYDHSNGVDGSPEKYTIYLNNPLREIKLPDDTREIATPFFAYMYNLTSVSGDNIQKICDFVGEGVDGCFAECYHLSGNVIEELLKNVKLVNNKTFVHAGEFAGIEKLDLRNTCIEGFGSSVFQSYYDTSEFISTILNIYNYEVTDDDKAKHNKLKAVHFPKTLKSLSHIKVFDDYLNLELFDLRECTQIEKIDVRAFNHLGDIDGRTGSYAPTTYILLPDITYNYDMVEMTLSNNYFLSSYVFCVPDVNDAMGNAKSFWTIYVNSVMTEDCFANGEMATVKTFSELKDDPDFPEEYKAYLTVPAE